MNDVFAEILRLKEQGHRGALCTIISSKGSLPMSGKAKMLVGDDGTMVGTVGGGCLTWESLRHFKRAGSSAGR